MFRKEPEAEFALLERTSTGHIQENSYIVTAGNEAPSAGLNKLKDKITKIRPKSHVNTPEIGMSSPGDDWSAQFPAKNAWPSGPGKTQSKHASTPSSTSNGVSLTEPSQELLDILAMVDPTNEKLTGISRVSQFFAQPEDASDSSRSLSHDGIQPSHNAQSPEPKRSHLASSIMSSFGQPDSSAMTPPKQQAPVSQQAPTSDFDPTSPNSIQIQVSNEKRSAVIDNEYGDEGYDSDDSFTAGDEKRLSVHSAADFSPASKSNPPQTPDLSSSAFAQRELSNSPSTPPSQRYPDSMYVNQGSVSSRQASYPASLSPEMAQQGFSYTPASPGQDLSLRPVNSYDNQITPLAVNKPTSRTPSQSSTYQTQPNIHLSELEAELDSMMPSESQRQQYSQPQYQYTRNDLPPQQQIYNQPVHPMQSVQQPMRQQQPMQQQQPSLVLPSQEVKYSDELMHQYERELASQADSRDQRHHPVPSLEVSQHEGDRPGSVFEEHAARTDQQRANRRSFFGISRSRSPSAARTPDEKQSTVNPFQDSEPAPSQALRQSETQINAEWEKQAEHLALHVPSETSLSSAGQKKTSRLSIFTGRHRSHSDANSIHSSHEKSPVVPSSEAFPRPPLSPYLGQERSEAERNMAVTFSKSTDERLQYAIDLHESGKLEEASQIFEELADPKKINHPLAQVLCGLSYRHGWGVPANAEKAFQYLRLAAENSALVDQIAAAGGAVGIKGSSSNKSKKGIAKGELVLSIYELGNCFRYGWGTEKDPGLAKQYYETAARLGDVDAMAETAWCYMNGFGMKKKDKFRAAQYYRMAEKAGKVEVGNSWIWKDKYNP